MRLLRERWFALLVGGVAIDAAGRGAALIALWGFAAYKFDAGPSQIAILGLSWAAPAALIGPFAGVPIDRLGPRKVLIGAQIIGAASALAMIGAHTWSHLVYVGIGTGVAKAFVYPAADALPPRLVDEDDLLTANSLLGAATDSAIVFGPLLAAGAIAVAGLRGAFVIDAATYLVGMLAVIPLQLRPVPVDPARAEAIGIADVSGAKGVFREIGDGIRTARDTPMLRWTLTLSIAVFLTWGTFVVVEPLYARDVLHTTPTMFAFFQAAFGTALVVTGLLVPRLGDRATSTAVLAATVTLSGVTAALYVGTHALPAAFAGVALWGVDVGFFAAPSRTLLQRHSPTVLHGRVLALNRTLHNMADVVSLPLAGLVMGVAGPQGTGLAVGAMALVAGLVGYRLRPRPQVDPVDNARKTQGSPSSLPQALVPTVDTCPPTASSSATTR
jgi:MFS family permease